MDELLLTCPLLCWLRAEVEKAREVSIEDQRTASTMRRREEAVWVGGWVGQLSSLIEENGAI